MSEHVDFLLLGLGNGAVYGALAVAIVIVYRSSGVLNFATGAMALQSAQTYVFLRQGSLLVLIPLLPTTLGVGGPWGFWPAVLVTILLEAAFGLVLYFVVFRPLRRRSGLAKVVASLGVMVMLGGLVGQRALDGPALAPPIFPSGRLEFGGSFITTDRLYLALAVFALALGLSAIDRFTPFGLATRAASETEVGAVVSGLSPTRIGAANWALGGAVVALAGVLIAPLTPLQPTTYTLFVVPAMAAAVIGRFTRMVPAALSGLAIGMLQSEVVLLQSTYEWMPDSGAGELIPLLLVLAVLVARSPRIPLRGSLPRQVVDTARAPRSLLIPTLVFVPVGVLAIFILEGSIRSALYTSLIMSMFGLSLVVVTGYLGLISLAQLSIGGVAGFLLATFTSDWGIPFPIAPILAATCAALVGVLIGLPALRVRGMLVAVVTLMLAVALEAVWFRNPQFSGGLDGNSVESPTLFGIDFGIGSGDSFPRPAFGLLCLGVLTGTALSVGALRSSRLGYNLLAVRTNERSAAAGGVNVVRTKLTGFAIGAFIAGLGGALLAYKNTRVSFESYNVISGLLVFAVAYVSGIASIAGGIISGLLAIGGLAFVAVDRSVELGLWYSVVVGVALILAVILQPQGIAGAVNALLARVAWKRSTPAAPSAPVRSAGSTTPTKDADPSPDARTAPQREALMTITDLSVHYAGVAALRDVSLDIPHGAIVGLIGPNGAGKTTLLDALSGLTPATGTVTFAGSALTGAPHVRARRGMARTFQGLDLYDQLTVHENVAIGANVDAGRDGVAADRVSRLLAELGLDQLADEPVSSLPQGHRQLVSIARSLAGQPELVMLDEPAAGLDATESSWLGGQLGTIRAQGTTVLLVEHDMALVLGVCDLVHVLDFGEIIARGSPAEIRASAAVASAYLGTPKLEGHT